MVTCYQIDRWRCLRRGLMASQACEAGGDVSRALELLALMEVEEVPSPQEVLSPWALTAAA